MKPQARWVVEWWELTPYAKRLIQDEKDGGPSYEHDRDTHEQAHYAVYKRQEDARVKAREIVQSKVTVYGHAMVQLEHRLPVEGTNQWDWEPIGEPECID